jgi:hypothetical protein
MKIRLQADADLKHSIVAGVLRREPEIDFQSALAAGLHGLLDPEVLALAAQEGRILVTHDKRTMPGHFAEFIEQQDSPGVFVVPQDMAVAAAIEELVLIWAASAPESGLTASYIFPYKREPGCPLRKL